jgi:hypothetical protein
MRVGTLSFVFALVMAASLSTGDAHADEPVMLDRIVARWSTPETGGVQKPRYVFARELAFEARLEAIAGLRDDAHLSDRQIRAALDRHIAETMLASLPIVPAPTPKEVAVRAELARRMLEQRVHGAQRLVAAAAAEAIGSDELDVLFRRQARASLYLDRMMAPMLEPTEAELRDVWRSHATPFGKQPYEQIADPLKRWYVAQRVARALEAYYLTARARVTLLLVVAETLPSRDHVADPVVDRRLGPAPRTLSFATWGKSSAAG